MRLGVSGFQGSRLIQAREGRGLTQTALSKLIGRSSAAISRWERGEQLPEKEALDSLERYLNIPSNWFLKPYPNYGSKPYFFRSKAAITLSSRSVARARLDFTNDISLKLQDWVDWPTVNVPSLGATDYLKIRDEDIEKIALDLRKHWNLGFGPISDITLLLENAGVVIAKEEIGYSNMDGLSKWFDSDDRPYIFLATDKANYFRQRFDAAHELAHLVLHRHLSDIEFNNRYADIERQANIFAGIFLLPSESFSAEISTPSLVTFNALKSRWKTSIGCMISRAKQLEVITEDYAVRLWKNYGARGWRKGEPGDELQEPENVRLMPRAIKLLLDDGGFNRDRLLSEIGLFSTDVESLCGLPSGFLSADTANNVFELKLRPSPNSKAIETQTSGNVFDMAHRRN